MDPNGSRLSLRSWESLPSEGRPPQLFPAPRTVKWSLHRICGKAIRFSLSLSRQSQCQSWLYRGHYRVIIKLSRIKVLPYSLCFGALFIRSDWDPSILSFCICIPSESPRRTSQTLQPSYRWLSQLLLVRHKDEMTLGPCIESCMSQHHRCIITI